MTPEEETTQATPEVETTENPEENSAELEKRVEEAGETEVEPQLPDSIGLGEMSEPENQNKFAMNAMLYRLFNFIRVQGKNGQTNAAYDGGRLIFKSFSMTVGANDTFVLYKFGDGEQVIWDPEAELNYDFINEFLQKELMM